MIGIESINESINESVAIYCFYPLIAWYLSIETSDSSTNSCFISKELVVVLSLRNYFQISSLQLYDFAIFFFVVSISIVYLDKKAVLGFAVCNLYTFINTW